MTLQGPQIDCRFYSHVRDFIGRTEKFGTYYGMSEKDTSSP
jgi:hypothetical protein